MKVVMGCHLLEKQNNRFKKRVEFHCMGKELECGIDENKRRDVMFIFYLMLEFLFELSCNIYVVFCLIFGKVLS